MALKILESLFARFRLSLALLLASLVRVRQQIALLAHQQIMLTIEFFQAHPVSARLFTLPQVILLLVSRYVEMG